MRRKGESAIPTLRPPIPLNVGHPVGWYGLEVDDGAGSTVELVNGLGIPNNESSAQYVTVSRLRIEGGRVGVEGYSTTFWHEVEELDLRLAPVTGLRGKEEERLTAMVFEPVAMAQFEKYILHFLPVVGTVKEIRVVMSLPSEPCSM